MKSSVTITEILGRAEQGMTRPFICRGDDLLTYYVKGAYAGRRSLCCEWVANRLAVRVLSGALPGAPLFAKAEVPEALIKGSARGDARDLGAGWVFASLRLEGGQELSWAAAQGWPEEAMARLLFLDLWLQNEDRSLSVLGGNPNLLVTQAAPLPGDKAEGAQGDFPPGQQRLWVYDFNLAFDEGFSRERFFGAHVYGEALRHWPEQFRERMEPLMHEALSELDVIFDELPLEWLYVDGDDSLPAQLDRERVRSVLELPFCERDTFWKLP
jgi:hypothetical protein